MIRENIVLTGEKPLMIAHRGASCLERENTCAAFVAAGNRTYFGIETDVHETSDGKLIVIHDDRTGRVSPEDLPVGETTFEKLRSIRLYDTDGTTLRGDLCLPTPEEFARICARYGKHPVLEFKNRISPRSIRRTVQIMDENGILQDTIFISFAAENLLELRQYHPGAHAQFLTDRMDGDVLNFLCENRMGIDVYWRSVTAELAERFHEKGIEINCWTADDPEDCMALAQMGVDYITSNRCE